MRKDVPTLEFPDHIALESNDLSLGLRIEPFGDISPQSDLRLRARFVDDRQIALRQLLVVPRSELQIAAFLFKCKIFFDF